MIDKMDETIATNWFSDDHATFGDRLSVAREGAGLSQKKLAARLGVKLSVIRAWEEDRKEPRANRLQMLSGMLGCSLSWLLTGEGEAPVQAEPSALDTESQSLLAEIRTVHAQIKQAYERLGVLEKRLRKTLTEESTGASGNS